VWCIKSVIKHTMVILEHKHSMQQLIIGKHFEM